jgi:transcriptional regulator with XRE-family HTH domain
MVLHEALLRDVGARIAEIRRARGLTQSELAERMGSNEKHLQRIEAGQENLTLRSVASIAEALEADTASLFQPPISLQRRRGRPPRAAFAGTESPAWAEQLLRPGVESLFTQVIPLLTVEASPSTPHLLADHGVAVWVEVPSSRRGELGLFGLRVAHLDAPAVRGASYLCRVGPPVTDDDPVGVMLRDPRDKRGRYRLRGLFFHEAPEAANTPLSNAHVVATVLSRLPGQA